MLYKSRTLRRSYDFEVDMSDYDVYCLFGCNWNANRKIATPTTTKAVA